MMRAVYVPGAGDVGVQVKEPDAQEPWATEMPLLVSMAQVNVAVPGALPSVGRVTVSPRGVVVVGARDGALVVARPAAVTG